jgi:hypothetical protein
MVQPDGAQKAHRDIEDIAADDHAGGGPVANQNTHASSGAGRPAVPASEGDASTAPWKPGDGIPTYDDHNGGGDQWSVPDPPASDNQPQGQPADKVAVDLDDLRSYAVFLKGISENAAKSQLYFTEHHDVRPGLFPQAYALFADVEGEGNRTHTFLGEIADVCVNSNAMLLATLDKYKNAEDLNELTAQDVNNEFNLTFGGIDHLADQGKKPS